MRLFSAQCRLLTGGSTRRAAALAAALCAFIACLAARAEFVNPHGVALIVGNADYEHRAKKGRSSSLASRQDAALGVLPGIALPAFKRRWLPGAG